MPPADDLVEAVKAFFSCSVLIGLAVGLAWMLLRLQRAASRMPLVDRHAEPTLVWLLLIPIFHLWWSFRMAKGIALGVEDARAKASLPERPSGRGIGAAAAWSLLGSALTLLLALAASALAALAAASPEGDGPDGPPVQFFRGLASGFGVITLLWWIATAACFVAFVHQVEAATDELRDDH